MNLILCIIITIVGLKSFAGSFELSESASKKSKTLIFVHGGAWIGGQISQYRTVAAALNREGFCGVLAEYSLAPGAQHPVPVTELNSTIEALKKKNSTHCDFQKLYLVGHSAGAHMIAYWASVYADPAVRGFVGLEGIYDVAHLAQAWPNYKDWFLNAEFGAEKKWAAASPNQKKIKSQKSWLVVHSKKDELVDLKQSVDFVGHLKEQKINAEFLQLESDSHFEVVKKLNDENSELMKKIKLFVDQN